ncbi:putative GATA transcription factor 22 [Carex littledalei]|uniref:Putative GATA transcription factor 22 n=1 Tax=Carex littledalei TaxID=544730 RepID=A0A833QRZ9_9POAL|nr:putative GATA transcription factor 22 [Carex littledalei]
MNQALQDWHVPVLPLEADQYRPYPMPPYLLNSLQDQKHDLMQYWMENTTVSDQSTSVQQKPNKAVSSRSTSNVIRVCSNCNTTTTPLWRSGPCGPKSLCNACGIRQRKARRAALMAMEAVKGGTILPIKPKIQVKKERKNKDHTLPYKKRYKFLSPVIAKRKSTAKSLLLCQEFPKEETDAATLLMGLSCGVLRG